MINSVIWPTTAGPYDYFTYPAGVFYGRVILGKLSLVHVPLIHPGAAQLAEAAIVIVACAWVVSGFFRRAAVPAAAVMGVGVLALSSAGLLYSLEKFTTGAGAGAGGPGASERSWVDAHVPAGAGLGEMGIGLGETPAYTPVWQSLVYWNTSVSQAISFNPTSFPVLPFGVPAVLASTEGPSGRLSARLAPPYTGRVVVPRYVLVPQQGTNPYGFEGTTVGNDPALPLELIRLKQPAHASWAIVGTTPEGFIYRERLGIATVFSGALAGSAPKCATFSLIAPPAFPGRWPYKILSGARRVLARGSLVAQQHQPVEVPLVANGPAGKSTATVTVEVKGAVPTVTGVVSAQIAFFGVEDCRRLHS